MHAHRRYQNQLSLSIAAMSSVFESFASFSPLAWGSTFYNVLLSEIKEVFKFVVNLSLSMQGRKQHCPHECSPTSTLGHLVRKALAHKLTCSRMDFLPMGEFYFIFYVGCVPDAALLYLSISH